MPFQPLLINNINFDILLKSSCMRISLKLINRAYIVLLLQKYHLRGLIFIMKFFPVFWTSFLLVFGRAQLGETRSVKVPEFGRSLREEFFFPPNFVQLNHGAFGTYPKAVSRALREYQERVERNPDLWIRRDARTGWDKVREMFADIVNADSDDLVLVPNTTSGINAILRSMIFAFGQRILHLSTIFTSMNSLIQYLIDNSKGGLSRIVFNVSYPITNEVFLKRFEAFLEEIHDPEKPIRLALIDHISSMPVVLYPVDKMVRMLKRYNITVLVDGANAIGQVPINITALAPDYYVTNAHKWLYAARGCAVLYVDKKLQGTVHPVHITNMYKPIADFQNEFHWIGTFDYISYMTVPAAIQFRKDVGGEDLIMQYTHNLALEGGRLMATRLGTEVLQYPDQTASMFDVRLPVNHPDDPRINSSWWLDTQLSKYPNTYSPVHKHNGQWWARISAQIYNDISDFETSAQHFLAIVNELNNSLNSTISN